MARDTLYLYITDIAAYLNGDRTFCINVEDEPPSDDRRVIGAYADRLFLAEVSVECLHSIASMTEYALERIDKKEKTVIAEKEVQMNALKEAREKLLCLPHLGAIV